jgi:hypothetical protein
VVDLRQALVASWRRRVHDGDQGDTESLKTWSASSIAFCCAEERRLEMVRCWGGSADGVYVVFSVVFGRIRVSEGVPEKGKRFRRRKRGAGSLMV